MLMRTERPKEFDKAMMEAMPSLRSFAVSLARDYVRGEDLLQETLLFLMANHTTLDHVANIKPWAFTVTRNLFLSQWRKRKREVEDPDSVAAGRLESADDQFEVLRCKQALKRLRHIPKEQRDALLAIGYEGVSYEDAAERLGVSVGTVKSRVNRARGFLEGDPRAEAEDVADVVAPPAFDRSAVIKLYNSGRSAGQIVELVPGATRADVMALIMGLPTRGKRPKWKTAPHMATT